MIGMQLDFARAWLDSRIAQDEETGATMIEYVLMVALIALVAIGAVTVLGTETKDKFCDSAKKLDSTATC